MSIKVVVQGALGRAGRAAVEILCREPGIDVVGVVDMLVSEKYLHLPDGSGKVPSSSNLDYILTTCQPDVLVDFTEPSATMSAVHTATKRKVNLVIGTTGLTSDQISEIDHLARAAGVGALMGTLSFGVVLVAHLASIAAKYFDYAEIVDLAKLEKLDAPSGASLDIAKAMTRARGKPFELPQGQEKAPASRGGQYEGVTIHSLRLSDAYIHQQVILGTRAGTMVTIGLELTSSEYLRPGIVIAVKEAVKQKGLVYGLDDVFLGVQMGNEV
ncbi:MAG: 4-hydroxy-tetrahydrodipicolinate reductase [Dehalococcoidia bacterium]|nr:MAG: 4-hydroxy-tetrahydrodipicolinate reductase [Dehalococcoidia bacterium]